MDACFRFNDDDVVTGSSAFFIRLRYASHPRLYGNALCNVVRYAYFIISICSGRRLANEGRDTRSRDRQDLKGLIGVVIRRTEIHGSHIYDRYFLANAEARQETQLIRDGVAIEAGASRGRISATVQFSLFFVAYAFDVRVNDVSVWGIHILQFSISVTRRIIPRGEVMTFQVFFQRSCMFIRIRDGGVLRQCSSFFVRISRYLVRAR